MSFPHVGTLYDVTRVHQVGDRDCVGCESRLFFPSPCAICGNGLLHGEVEQGPIPLLTCCDNCQQDAFGRACDVLEFARQDAH